MLPVTLRRRPANSHPNSYAWNSPLDLLSDEIDQWFGRAINSDTTELTAAYPVDIREDKDAFYVDAEMPGYAKDEIEITLENGVLQISAQRQRESDDNENGQSHHIRERRYTRVARRFALPTTVDEQKVDAKLADGVLRLTIAKREEVKPKKITVS